MFKEFPFTQVTNEEIQKRGLKWSMLNNVDKLLHSKSVGLLNIDYTDGDGTHWTGVFTNKNNKTVFFYDPLGFKNDGNYPATGGNNFEKTHHVPYELCAAADRRGYDRVVTNRHYNQYLKSWLCGHYVLYFIDIVKPYVNNETLDKEMFEKLLYDNLGKSPNKEVVEKVMTWYRNTRINR